MAMEQDLMSELGTQIVVSRIIDAVVVTRRRCPESAPGRSAERISRRASRKESVDSAPWFSFGRSA
jgi:hypothetical protein